MMADPRRDIGIMMQEIGQLPDLLRSQTANTWKAVQILLDDIDLKTIPRVVLTGCGDSYFVGLAARWAFERFAGLPTEAVEALDFTRYYVDSLPQQALVLPVSYSGQVARTVEAAYQAQQHGATVIAITGRPERRLGQTAPRLLTLHIPSLGFSPGTTTYIGLLLATYLLAIGIGQRRSVLGQERIDVLFAQLDHAATLIEQAISQDSDAGQLREEAEFLAQSETVLFLGCGPNWASALFGAAKLFEGPELNGIAQNTEEWAHAQYFVSSETSRTVLLAPAGRSLDRAKQIAAEMAFIGTPFLVITDDPDIGSWTNLTPHVAPLPPGLPEVFTPLLFAVPLSLLGFYLAAARGKTSYNFKSPEHEREHYATLHDSPFLDLTTMPLDGD